MPNARGKKSQEQQRAVLGPLALVIIDGFGITDVTEGNAVVAAKTPNFDAYMKKYPHTELAASGKDVGLPDGQDGNSEAGHMNIGAGRVVEQDAVLISEYINTGAFFQNPAFIQAVRHVKRKRSNMHIMGLLTGFNSAHSYLDHLIALLALMRNEGLTKVYLHLFTDGRDMSPYSAIDLLRKVQRVIADNHATIATITGRLYAMDRKKEWSRTESTYNTLVHGRGKHTARTAEEAVLNAYNRGQSDEFIEPTVIVDEKGKPLARIADDDAVIFFNLRSDRARQLAKVFVQKNFAARNPHAFEPQGLPKNLLFVAMTDFGPDLEGMITAYPAKKILQTLPTQLKGLRQMYIAEKEKYAHVTYFMNGGYKDPVAGEERVIVPSPRLDHYDEKPAMSSREITEIVLASLKKDAHDVYVINYAPPDMIGHTGNFEATVKAVEGIDVELGRLSEVLLKKNGVMLLTADHGNAEQMLHEDGRVDSEHTKNPVPFIVIGNTQIKKGMLRKHGRLADIAPTILTLLGRKVPPLMTGKSLW
ncbi:MAG: 2,3-bisphosphoglycerate-independent phosphoglycerate mutase [Patescibacteria group bacterium]|jgi:2,3-bisphosphoglycerate-independent phosphoglycerate mutase